MPTLHVDDKTYEVKAGKNLLETCLTLGFDLPYFCWHPALGSVGACRQCAVKVYLNDEDRKGKLVMSCMESVTDGQRISICDPEAKEFRENVIGWLMTNHPHDCAVCDEGGSCHLQDMTVMTGHAYREFRYRKRTYRNQYLGPFLNHEMNRCIQCYRCVRFYKDYAGGHDLDAFSSGNRVFFGRSEEGVLENEFSGNLAEVCPTGVFTDKTLKQHYTRKWDLTMAPSVCTHCSLGCNTIAGERYGSLRMISNRYNGEVNGYFLCDRGRFGYEFANAPSRIRSPRLLNGAHHEATIDKVLATAKSLHGSRLLGIGSPRASLESNYLLSRIVGEGNFYHGVSREEYDACGVVAEILSKGSVPSFSMKEVENCDVVLIWGEDLTNTAPMLALAVRQACRNRPMEKAREVRIPDWNDAAVRERTQEERGPVVIGSTMPSKLDEVATYSFRASPTDLARTGFAIAQLIDNDAPRVSDLTEEEAGVSRYIAGILMDAECPVIISGTSTGSPAVIRAAANIAFALHRRNTRTGIVLAQPACNSLGLALMDGKPFADIPRVSGATPDDTLIVLETDLYRHEEYDAIDHLLGQFKNVIVLDHTHHQTTEKANILIPAGTFAEGDGILVNNEGRAQRFFQVYEPSGSILESWRWLLNIGNALGGDSFMQWNNHDDVVNAMAEALEVFRRVRELTPAADFRINGQRIPRQPPRYSGRTAMHAAADVSEPKPPVDQDSPLSYTMEGSRLRPPSSAIPFFWAPGWNSIQAVNKYQQETGGALKGGDPGIRLLEPSPDGAKYFDSIPPRFQPEAGEVLVVPIHHIFGSEEMSSIAPAVAQRCASPQIVIGTKLASALEADEDKVIRLMVNGKVYSYPASINKDLPESVACLPAGLREVGYCKLPAPGRFIH